MNKFQEDVADDQWDDDFDDSQQLTARSNTEVTNPPLRVTSLQQFHPTNVREPSNFLDFVTPVEDEDEIINVGFDCLSDISEEENTSSEPLKLPQKTEEGPSMFHAQEHTHYKTPSKEVVLPKSAASPIDITKVNTKAGTDISYANSDPSSHSTTSSTHPHVTTSNADTNTDRNGGAVSGGDDEEEEDWDQEMFIEDPDQPDAPSSSDDRSGRPLQQFAQLADSAQANDEKESMFDYLRINLKEQMCYNSVDPRRSVRSTTSSLEEDQLEEDSAIPHNYGAQHLSGLIRWTSFARRRLEEHFHRGNFDIAEMVQEETNASELNATMAADMIERCEAHASEASESNLFALQIVIKWLLGLSLLSVDEDVELAKRLEISRRSIDLLQPIQVRILTKFLAYKDQLLEEFASLKAHGRPRVKMTLLPDLLDSFALELIEVLDIFRLTVKLLEVLVHLSIEQRGDGSYLRSLQFEIERQYNDLNMVALSALELFYAFLPFPNIKQIQSSRYTVEFYGFWIQEDQFRVKNMMTEFWSTSSGQKAERRWISEHSFVTLYTASVELLACLGSCKLFLLGEISPILFRSGRCCSHGNSYSNNGLRCRPSKGVGPSATIYDLAYDLTVASQCADLLNRLHGPNLVRAQLSFALFSYVSRLKEKVLPWQRDISLFKFVIPASKKGSGYQQLTKLEAERAVMKELLSKFPHIDEPGNQQIVLLEIASDLFPTSELIPQDQSPESWQVKKRHMNYFSGLFGHASQFLNLLSSTRDVIVPGEKPASPSGSSHGGRGIGASMLVELLHFTNQYAIALTSLLNYLPMLTLEVEELRLFIATCLKNPKENVTPILDRLFLLAIQTQKNGRIVRFGERLLENLQSLSSKTDPMKVMYILSRIINALIDDVRYEQAAYLALKHMSTVWSWLPPKPSVEHHHRHRRAVHGMECVARTLEDLLSKHVGGLYLQLNRYVDGIRYISQLLLSLASRPASLPNDVAQVEALIMLLSAVYELRDFEACHRIIASIKFVRHHRLEPLLAQFGDLSHDLAPHLRGVDQVSASGSNNSSLNSMSGFFGINGPTRNSATARASLVASNDSNNSSGASYDRSGSTTALRVDAKALYYSWNSVNMYTPGVSLPNFCVTHHNLDLGIPLAKIYFKCELFASALAAMAPAFLCVENAVRGRLGERKAQLDLARIYYLRGIIEFEAVRSAKQLKFPIEIGSPELFTALHKIFALFPAHCVRGRKYSLYLNHAYDPKNVGGHFSRLLSSKLIADNSSSLPDFSFSGRKAQIFHNAADLLWDAFRWFRKAWDLFHTAGDDFGAAKAANRLAQCHILPTFVPNALLHVPLQKAADLANFRKSNFPQLQQQQVPVANGSPRKGNNAQRFDFERVMPTGAAASPRSGRPPPSTAGLPASNTGSALPTPMSLASSATNGHGPSTGPTVRRMVSLEEAEQVSNFSLDVFLDVSLPFSLIGSYLNLAELNVLKGQKKEAFVLWWEAQQLFVELFIDGCLVPLLRRSSVSFCTKLKVILERLVIFLWLPEWRRVRTEHLYLLDTVIIVGIEEARLLRNRATKARSCSDSLKRTINRLHVLHERERGYIECEEARVTSMMRPPAPPAPLQQQPIQSCSKTEEANARRYPRNDRGSFWSNVVGVFSCTSRAVSSTASQGPPRKTSANRMEEVPVSAPSVILPSVAMNVGTNRLSNSKNGGQERIQFANAFKTTLESLVKRTHDQSLLDFSLQLLLGSVEKKILDYSWLPSIDALFSVSPTYGGHGSQPTLTKQLRMEHILSWADVVQGDDDIDDNISADIVMKISQRRPLDPLTDFDMSNPRRRSRERPNHIFQLENRDWENERLETFNTYFTLSVGKDVNLDSFGTLDSMNPEFCASCEMLLIERIWRLLVRCKSLSRPHTNRHLPARTIKGVVRRLLLKFTRLMLQLRAFSRQWKPSGMLELLRGGDISHYNSEESRKTQPLRFDTRLGQVVFLLQIDDLLLGFHPRSNRELCQQLGGAGSWTAAALEYEDKFSLDVHSPSTMGIAQRLNGGAPDWQLPVNLTRILYDFGVADSDLQCGGGQEQRSMVLTSLRRSGVLKGVLQFLTDCAWPISSISNDSSSLSNTMHRVSSVSGRMDSDLMTVSASTIADPTGSLQHMNSALTIGGSVRKTNISEFDIRRVPSENLAGLMFSNNSQRVTTISPNNARSTPPEVAVPLTLVCGFPAQALPWEVVIAPLPAVRALSMIAFAAEAAATCLSLGTANAISGPSSNRRGVLVLLSTNNADSADPSITEEVSRKIAQRRVETVINSISSLRHPVDHLPLYYDNNEDGPRKRNSLNQATRIPRAALWLRSARLPLSSSADALRHANDPHLFPRATLVVRRIDQEMDPTVWWQVHEDDLVRQEQVMHYKQYAIVLLSYCDLLDMSEGTKLLLRKNGSHSRVVIFAPHFIQEKLLVELKIAMDRWGGGHATAGESSVSVGAPPSGISVGHSFQQHISVDHQTRMPALPPKLVPPPLPLNIRKETIVAASSLSSAKSGLDSEEEKPSRSPPRPDEEVLPLFSAPISSTPHHHQHQHPIKAKQKTYAYHIIMSVVGQLQMENSVHIAVFM